MTATSTSTMNRPPLRLWPGVAIVVSGAAIRYGLPRLAPDQLPVAVMTGMATAPLVALWWLFASRARGLERWGAVPLAVALIGLTPPLLDRSIATGGQGMLFLIYALPLVAIGFVAWAGLAQRLATAPRRLALVLTLVAACGFWTLLRTGGTTGDFESELAWRWSQTPEQQLLGQALAGTTPTGRAALPETGPAAWPGFRGPSRNGIRPGEGIVEDWQVEPPRELWREEIGPGWSSFAIHGDYCFTQEQRGEDEAVSCYDARSGELVWMHRDPVRFWESNGGAGPRGTPTIDGDRLYALGATGIVNALDARTGRLIWSQNAVRDSGVEVPTWGVSGSPLVLDQKVVVAASGRLVAYDRADGALAWLGPEGDTSYSSPHRAILGGVEQIVHLRGQGVVGLRPSDGAVLWQHAWEGYPIVQPAILDDGDLLVSVSASSGTRRLRVIRSEDGWSVAEQWTSGGLKPYFNDFVVHEGHAYGFDGSILACIELDGGERRWKGGRYGNGQLVLLPEQDLLLVLSERGELALVDAVPDGFNERARMPAIEGKSWNHPVVIDGLLLVRNDREMAAFDIAADAGRQEIRQAASAP